MKNNKQKKHSMFVGMDVDKECIDLAVGEVGRQKEVRYWGRIAYDYSALEKWARKQVSLGFALHFCYEAGPTGYELYRFLTSKGYDCSVVAPSMIPRKSGDRVKTNRRDAINLTRLHRAGELTPIYVPQREDEAIRDMVRARRDAIEAQTRARQQLLALLLRNGIKYSAKTNWTAAHLRYLGRIKLPHAAQQVVFEEYKTAVDESTKRVERLTEQIRTFLGHWRMRPVVEALQALRGVRFITSVTIVAELGDLSRFTNPQQLMSYLGLVPSEHSTGSKRRPGSITKSGNIYARTALVESSWAYYRPARVTRELQTRQQNLPEAIKKIAWKAQLRLCARYRRLMARGKNKQVAITAIARELSGFVWAIAREVKVEA